MSEVSDKASEVNAPSARRRGVGWWVSLLLVLAMAVGCGVYGLHVWQQRAFTKMIEARGGQIVFSPIGSEGFVDAMPGFYRRSFTYISAVRLKNTVVGDDLVDMLASRPGLRIVHFVDCEVSDAIRARLDDELSGVDVRITGEYKMHVFP